MADMQNGVKSLYEIERICNICFPTSDYERFVHYAIQKCGETAIAGFLKGSLVKGTAQEFSDVDLVLTGLNTSEDIDALITSFGSILLSEKTAISTFMVIYTCGLAVEYDIRKTVTLADIRKSIALSQAKYQVSDIPKDRVNIESSACPRRDKVYSRLMIVQMCCAKLLCQKPELSRDIYCDRMNLLYGSSYLSADFVQQVHSETLRQFVERLKSHVFSIENISMPTLITSHTFLILSKADSNGGIVGC